MRERRAPADIAANTEPGGLLYQYYWLAVLGVLCVLGFLAAIAWWVRRCRLGVGSYDYSALEDESNQLERLELARKAQRSASREKAQTTCHMYLRTTPRYTFVEHLNDVGSRVDKHWFVVRDTSVKTERLITFVPRNSQSPIPFTEQNCRLLVQLFVALQHPYIYPVLNLVFQELAGVIYLICMIPLNYKGSLKDLIYRSCWQEDWALKYGEKSAGLPLSQVQRLGRQILEALVFLKVRGFTPYGHLHSGNVILQNGVARLAGIENTLLGYNSRVHTVIWGRVGKSDPETVDIICFGHVLFEMCAGYEMNSARPTANHYNDIHEYPQVQQILEFIFSHPEGRYPTLEEVSYCDFFRNLDLRELRSMRMQGPLSPALLNLLHEVKVYQKGKRSSCRRIHSASTSELQASDNMTPIHTERRSSSPVASTSRLQPGEIHYSQVPDSASPGISQEEEYPRSSSPVPSLYVTPQVSMSGLMDQSSDPPFKDSFSDADDEQSDYSPAKEHRRLTLHLEKTRPPIFLSSSERNVTCQMTSCLTRRLPSLS